MEAGNNRRRKENDSMLRIELRRMVIRVYGVHKFDGGNRPLVRGAHMEEFI
jgi:hypothetical protein